MNSTSKKAPTANSGRRKIHNDVIFISALLIIAICAGLLMYFVRGDGDSVIVMVDGKEYGTYPLSEDTVIDIADSGTNRLVIKDGKAYMEEASCPDGICVGHRPISRNGESIVCLPNRVVVTVASSKDKNSPDLVV